VAKIIVNKYQNVIDVSIYWKYILIISICENDNNLYEKKEERRKKKEERRRKKKKMANLKENIWLYKILTILYMTYHYHVNVSIQC